MNFSEYRCALITGSFLLHFLYPYDLVSSQIGASNDILFPISRIGGHISRKMTDKDSELLLSIRQSRFDASWRCLDDGHRHITAPWNLPWEMREIYSHRLLGEILTRRRDVMHSVATTLWTNGIAWKTKKKNPVIWLKYFLRSRYYINIVYRKW